MHSGKVKTISIQGGSNVHTQGRDAPSPHLRYNGWNSRPRTEHSRNNIVGSSPHSTLLTRALGSVISKGKMNKDLVCRTNSRSTLPPSWSCCRVYPASKFSTSFPCQGSQTSSPPPCRAELQPFPAVIQVPVEDCCL